MSSVSCSGQSRYSMLVAVDRSLETEREPVQDVPAVYFVMPTDENIRRICRVTQFLIPLLLHQSSRLSLSVFR